VVVGSVGPVRVEFRLSIGRRSMSFEDLETYAVYARDLCVAFDEGWVMSSPPQALRLFAGANDENVDIWLLAGMNDVALRAAEIGELACQRITRRSVANRRPRTRLAYAATLTSWSSFRWLLTGQEDFALVDRAQQLAHGFIGELRSSRTFSVSSVMRWMGRNACRLGDLTTGAEWFGRARQRARKSDNLGTLVQGEDLPLVEILLSGLKDGELNELATGMADDFFRAWRSGRRENRVTFLDLDDAVFIAYLLGKFTSRFAIQPFSRPNVVRSLRYAEILSE